MPKKIGYYICPGYVESKGDGNWHFIGARRLAELYGLSLRDPRVRVWPYEMSSLSMGVKPDEWIYLRPRYHGDYQLPPLNQHEKGAKG